MHTVASVDLPSECSVQLLSGRLECPVVCAGTFRLPSECWLVPFLQRLLLICRGVTRWGYICM